jgi:hypothetical protein
VSSPATPSEPIPVLDALGREFDRAVRSAPRWRRLPTALSWRLAVAVLIAAAVAFTTLTPTGRAVADRVGELIGIADDKAAIQAFCGSSRPCTVVDGFASPTESSPTRLVRPGEALAQEGRPISSCPEAAAAYSAAGIHVDAFVGPCPSTDELPAPTGGGADANLGRALDDLPGN